MALHNDERRKRALTLRPQVVGMARRLLPMRLEALRQPEHERSPPSSIHCFLGNSAKHSTAALWAKTLVSHCGTRLLRCAKRFQVRGMHV